MSRLVLIVAAGGALGALLRAAVAAGLPADPGRLPVGTLLVNLVGCLALGVVLSRWRGHRWLEAFLGPGVLGGFTTFSTFAVEVDRLLQSAPVTALAYVAASVLGGCAAAALGLRCR